MAGRRRAAAPRRRTRGEPDVYEQMLAEAGVSEPQHEPGPEPALKRRRRAQQPRAEAAAREEPGPARSEDESDDEGAGVEFEDVVVPEPTVQTVEDEPGDSDSDDDDVEFEDVDFAVPLADAAAGAPAELELNLTAHQSAASASGGRAARRRPMTKDERQRRIRIHQVHVLSLVAHASRRNAWCNDATVQALLRPHLSDKAAKLLNPGAHLSQFGQAESLKEGLRLAGEAWRAAFAVRERGLRRALWADDAAQLLDVSRSRACEGARAR